MTGPQQLTILLLCQSESVTALDRRALREAGADRVECMTSGVTAARVLARLDRPPVPFQPGMVVCAQQLSDMSGEQFCAILRLHPLLLDFPVLLILPNDNELDQLRTLGCGASALLARPYSINLLKRHIDALTASRAGREQLDKARQLTSSKDFDDALATYGILLKPVRRPEDFFRVGMQCLEQQQWNSAIAAFQRALCGALIQGKAELGMAAAWRGKGDMARYRHYLGKAAATFVRARQWHRARTVYARLLQEDPSARSPFLSAAMADMRAGNYDRAAETLAQGYAVTPRQQLCEKIAQACLGAEEPTNMLKSMEAALEPSLGEDAENLAMEIRSALDMLGKKAEARRSEEAAERHWRASRQVSGLPGGGSRTESVPKQSNTPTPERNTAASPSGQAATRSTAKKIRPARQHATPGVALAETSIPVVPLWGEQDREPPATPAHTADAATTAADSQPGGMPPHLDPLAKSGGLFNGKAGLPDLLSIMKFTWQTARRK